MAVILYISKESKNGEGRVGATPPHVLEYAKTGAVVYVENGAGEKSRFSDQLYDIPHNQETLGSSNILTIDAKLQNLTRRLGSPPVINCTTGGDGLIILKVKEVILPDESWMIQPYHQVISFGHLTSNEALTKYIIEKRGTYLSLEDIVENGKRPVLSGMSKIAGEEAVRLGMKYIAPQKPHLIIVGYGQVGKAAFTTAREEFGLLSASIVDLSDSYRTEFGKNHILYRTRREDIGQELNRIMAAHCSNRLPFLIILAPFIPERQAPKIVTLADLENITPNSVIIDISIDQGGACEFSQKTSHDNPYVNKFNKVDEKGNPAGVQFKYIGIPNIPGAVPERSTPVFSDSVFPYMLDICRQGFEDAVRTNTALKGAVSIYKGKVTSRGLAETFGLEHTPIENLL